MPPVDRHIGSTTALWKVIFLEICCRETHLRPAGGDPGLDHLQRYLTVCVSLSRLGPSETHEKLSMRHV